MSGGEFLDDSDDRNGHAEEKSKLLVRRAAYRRFSGWIDRQLAELVTRWAHLAPPSAQRFTRSARSSSKT
jgi:hypothetical protein